ncbi:MAG TPA: PH domain-containing protein [Thermoplasmata archaeon]|nr:PH domain-containing protein [Thermoplasmata archaeon]
MEDPTGATNRRSSFRAEYSYATIGTYVFIALLLVATSRAALVSSFPYVSDILAALFLIFLARYLSTRYWLDSGRLVAWRLFGSRHVPYEHVRRIEYGNLRDLGPVGFFGSWGWRGRMWSPVIGRFDSVYTTSNGLVVTGGPVPLFISPHDPRDFARELSRRVRSVVGALDVDVGAPGSAGQMIPDSSGF